MNTGEPATNLIQLPGPSVAHRRQYFVFTTSQTGCLMFEEEPRHSIGRWRNDEKEPDSQADSVLFLLRGHGAVLRRCLISPKAFKISIILFRSDAGTETTPTSTLPSDTSGSEGN